jgi:fibronectin-binding autotransporter adhesin
LAVVAFSLLTFAFSLQVRAADNVWVGDDNASNGAWSRTGNWTNNTAPNFQTNNRIVFKNNLTSTNMLYDLSGWVDASDINWDTSFNVSRTLQSSTAGGINFATRVENLSSNTQTVAMNLSGGKFGATGIELNPVNGDLVINGTIFNDNSLSYNIWGNTGRTLTLNSTLGPNATQSGVAFTIQRNTTVVLNTNQFWQGTTTLNGGNLRVGASGLLGNGAYSGAIVMNSFNGTNASLIFSNSAAQTLSGAISGTGSFTMAGSGTTILTGSNSYTGTTTISAGTLLANNTAGSALGSSTVTVQSGGTLGGNGSIAGPITIASGGNLTPGSGGAGALSLSNGLTLQSGATTTFLINSAASFTSINILGNSIAYGGALVFNIANYTPADGDIFTLFNMTSGATWSGSLFSVTGGSLFFTELSGIWSASDDSYSYQFSQATGQLSVTVVPEPSTYALLALGALALIVACRRRKSVA